MGSGGKMVNDADEKAVGSWADRSSRAKAAAIYYAVGTKRSVFMGAWRVAAAVARPPVHLRRSNVPMDVIHVNVLNDVVLEPKYGWVIANPYLLIEDSMTYGRRIRSWEGREWVGIPSPLAYRSGRSNAEHLDAAISACSFWPENFYHFAVEVLAKLQVCIDSPDIDHTLPILVNAELAETSFFRQARKRGSLADLNFVAVGDKHLHIDKLTTIVGESGESPESIDFPRLRHLIGEADLDGVDHPDKIFITRAAHRGRVPFNLSAVEALFASHGFTIFDLDNESFDTQVALFQSASKIAAIHGAALANLVWADPADTSMMELIPRTNDNELDAFVDLTRAMGMSYTGIRVAMLTNTRTSGPRSRSTSKNSIVRSSSSSRCPSPKRERAARRRLVYEVIDLR